jgi:hypothetical protein
MDESERTLESQALDEHPEVREQVLATEGFQTWIDSLPKFELDGETLYLPTGDVPVDEDQLVYQWARTNGLLEGEGPEQPSAS